MACFVHGTTGLGVQQLINLISFHSSKFSFRICYMLLFMRCGVTMKCRATLTHDKILRNFVHFLRCVVFTRCEEAPSQAQSLSSQGRSQVSTHFRQSLTHQSRTQTPLPSSFDILHRNHLLLLSLNAVHICHFQTPIHAKSRHDSAKSTKAPPPAQHGRHSNTP
jgi:hypothetical protein